jgi:hypothetical protein
MPLREDKIARRLSRSMNTKPPALLRRAAAQFNPEFVQRLLNLKKNNPELKKWADERRLDKREIIRQRIEGQNLMIPAGEFKEVETEKAFFKKLASTIGSILQEPEKKNELLETILGAHFRGRHPDDCGLIDEAFARFNHETFATYPLTLNLLVARLFYVYAPLVKIRATPDASLYKLVARGGGDQRNNLEDEQYIVAALMCHRLLTADRGMKAMMKVFKDGGFTRCETIFIDRDVPFDDQIPQLLV